MTSTDRARKLLSQGFTPPEVAHITGLHGAYVRKLIQRDDGRDIAWMRWREANPHKVNTYRQKQNADRRVARGANGTRTRQIRGRCQPSLAGSDGTG